MNYPIYMHNKTATKLIFNDVGLELDGDDFFLLESEDDLERFYYESPEVQNALTSLQIEFTQNNIAPLIVIDINAPVTTPADYVVKQDLTARDAIDVGDRKIGLLVHVIDEDKDYRLVGGITNSDWVQYFPEHEKLGGTIDHPLATSSLAGFMSPSDKQILLNLDPGSINANRYKLKEVQASTTSTNYQTYDTWTTNNLEIGTWIIRWMFKFNTDYYSTPGEFSVTLDGNEILNYKMAPAYNSNEALGAIGVTTFSFTSLGSHDFVIRFRRSGSTRRTVRLFASYLELIRVS